MRTQIKVERIISTANEAASEVRRSLAPELQACFREIRRAARDVFFKVTDKLPKTTGLDDAEIIFAARKIRDAILEMDTDSELLETLAGKIAADITALAEDPLTHVADSQLGALMKAAERARLVVSRRPTAFDSPNYQ